jgi:hypothetical protein
MLNKKKKIKDFFSGLQFNSQEHVYKHGGRQLSSVSSVIKKYVEPFNANLIAGFVAKKRGITKAEVLQEWEDKKNEACDKGNRVHDFGESYGHNLLGTHNVNCTPSDEYEKAVLAFWDSIPDHIEPFMFELQMFSVELGIAGTADIILYNIKTGKFIIADYKTNIDLFKNFKGKRMLSPFEYLLDSPFNKYQIQLSLYQHLFEQSGFEVESRRIIWLRPNGTFEMYLADNLINKLI